MPGPIRSTARRLLHSRIVRDSSMLMIASYTSLGLSMAGSIVVARILGPYNYGLLGLAMTIVSTIVQFMDIRTDEGLVRFVGNAVARDERIEARAFFNLGVGADFVLMVLTFALAALIAPFATRYFPDGAELRALVVVYAFSVPFSAWQGSFSSMLNAFKRFNLLAAAQITTALVQLGAVITMAPRGMVAVMWAYVASSAVSLLLYAVIGLWLAAREIGLGWRDIDREEYRAAWKAFLPFSLHTSVTQSIKALAVNADTLILGLVRPANEVAYYRIARSAASLITMPTAPVSSVIYPEMVEAWARDQVARVKQLVRRYALVTLGIGAALVVFYVVTARWLVEVFYGAEYYDAAPLIGRLIVIIGVGVALESTFRWVRPATLARGLPQLTTVYSVAAIAVRIVLLIPLTAALGALGGALTYDIVVVFTIGMIAFYVLPRLGLWTPPGQAASA